MYWLPVLGALSLAGTTIGAKQILKNKKLNIELYLVASFFAVVLIMLPFFWFFWKFESPALLPQNIFIFIMIVFFSIIANLFAHYALKGAKINQIEPAKVMEPLFVILLAVIFSFIFGEGLYERNFKIIIPAIIAGMALIFSHVENHHLKFSKYFVAAIMGSFFYALELVLAKLILDFYSPVSFYFLRCLGILFLGFFFFRPKFSKINTKTKFGIFGLGGGWVVYRLILYYGYLSLGIVSTTLVIMLGPIFVYLFAHWFLKEKMNWKNIVASVVIILCVLYGILI